VNDRLAWHVNRFCRLAAEFIPLNSKRIIAIVRTFI
jgi:hypothetical protein